jgi:hypothetical protein
MYCPKCGQLLPLQSSFCPACGNQVQSASGQPTCQGDTPFPQPYGQQPPLPPVPKSPKNPIGIILAIGLPVLALIILAALLVNGILSWPFTPPDIESTTTSSRSATTAKPTRSPSPGQTTGTTSAATEESSSAATTIQVTGRPINLSEAEILDYFAEIALKREYGGGDFDGVVCRWEQVVKVEIKGGYTNEDYDFLTSHIDWMNSLDGLPEISVVSSGGNYQVTFTSLDNMKNEIPGYVEGNWGFINLRWNDTGQITQANMGIATDVTNQAQRNHLILEEFTQGFGLLNDSPKYPDSIFQIEWTETQSLSSLDELVVRMLYSPVIEAGMKDNVLAALEDWLLTQDY